MDRRYSEEYERFRDQVKGCLDENWPLEGEEAELAERGPGLPRDRAADADK